MQAGCGLQKVLVLFNCQTPGSGGISAIDIAANYIVNTFIVISSIAAQSTIGQITMQISSAGSFRSALNVFISELSSMHEHSLYMQSLGDLEKIPRISNGNLISMPKEFHKIEFCNVSFSYPGANHNALNNISLSFQADKSYAIVGLNGSGKTTLLKLLLNSNLHNKDHTCLLPNILSIQARMPLHID